MAELKLLACLPHFISLVDSDVIDLDLIPRQPADGCYERSVKRLHFSTCTCQDHCRWDICRLADPPNECLFGTGGNWIWASREKTWIAQVTGGSMFKLIVINKLQDISKHVDILIIDPSTLHPLHIT